ncbi:MAG: DUF5597 domain-containing protein, partial [Dysgonamonadaceae bacterium]|nr:DUF5597 domain-containing protein [Dysgonamonadaceae bacterium]
HEAWISAGKKTSGTWPEVFGSAPIVNDFFMAWYYATYLEVIVAAGKAEYDIPMFTNAALIRPNYLPGQYNSGGPLPHSKDIYRAGAPHIDFISPDIYFQNFAYWGGRYNSDGNPLFVPETYSGEAGAGNAYYAFGQLDAIGFSPFGIDAFYGPPAGPGGATQNPLAAAYSTIDHLSQKIVEKQGTDKLSGIVLEGSEQRSGRISLGGYDVTINWASQPQMQNNQGNAMAIYQRVGILFLQESEDEFLIAGSGSATLSFAPSSGNQICGIVSIDEEVLVNDKWICQRRLNGDENGQGQVLRLSSAAVVYKVKLYKY